MTPSDHLQRRTPLLTFVRNVVDAGVDRYHHVSEEKLSSTCREPIFERYSLMATQFQ